MRKFCPTCGASLDDGLRFCSGCGTKIASKEESAQSIEQKLRQGKASKENMEQNDNTDGASSSVSHLSNRRRARRSGSSIEVFADDSADNPLDYDVYVEDEDLFHRFFRWRNRLNRKRFAVRWFQLVGVYLIVCFLVGLGIGFSGGDMSGKGRIFSQFMMVPFLPAFLALKVRRLHDLNHSGWWCFLWLVPLVNFFLTLYLFFAKGTEGSNDYGPDPLITED